MATEGTSWIVLILMNPQWLSAIAMFFTAFVALFGRLFVDWWRRPIIKFGLGNKEPHVFTYYTSNLMPHLFRLKVINEGKTVVKNCRVKIVSVSSYPGSNFEPGVLKWSNAPRDMRYRIDPSIEIDRVNDISNLPPIYREYKDISPNGGWEFCDLFLHGAGGDTIKFSSLGNRQFVTHDDSYIVEIEVSGDNLKPRKAKFEISKSNDFHRVKIGWI